MEIYIARYIVNIFDAIGMLLLISVILDYQLFQKRSIFYIIISAFYNGSIFLFYNWYSQNLGNIITVLLNILIILISIAIIYFTLNLKLITSVIIIVLDIIIEYINSTMLFLIFKILKIDYNVFDLKVFIFGSALMFLLFILFVYLIKLIKPLLSLPQNIKMKYLPFFIINIIFLSGIVALNISFFIKYLSVLRQEISLGATVTFAAIILLYFLYMIYFSSRVLKLDYFEQELEYQKFYSKSMDSLNSDLRRFKHDYDNTLAIINGYVKLKKIDELSDFLNGVISDKDSIKPANIFSLLNIKNVGLASILAAKMDKAREYNIDLKVSIPDEVNETKVRINDLCEIVGILLDNAIEAASESNEKSIKIAILKNAGEITFSIENSYKIKPDLSKIFLKGWSTKGNEHGMGLWIVDKILKKYKKAFLNTSITDTFFRQDLTIQ